ncbi:hypothetical protein JD969_10465 [Planctomycetota bacterium]|nr:hypothetical protein JD969_10465 [Planctomycetota bacterium]
MQSKTTSPQESTDASSQSKSDKKSKSRLYRVLRFCIIFIACNILLVIIAIFAWHNHLNNKVAQAFAPYQSKNIPLNLQQIDDNYQTPFTGFNAPDHYLPIFHQLQKIHTDNDVDLEDLSDQELIDATRKAAPFVDYIVPTDWHTRNITPPDYLYAASHAYLQNIQPHLDKLTNTPQFAGSRYSADFTLGIQTKLPHLGSIRHATKTLSLMHWLAVYENRPNDSVNALVAIHKLAESLKDEPMFISQLIRIAVHSKIIDNIEFALSRHIYNDAQLQQLQQLTQSIDIKAAINLCFTAERATVLHYINLFDQAKPLEAFGGFNIFRIILNKYSGISKLERIYVIDLFGKAESNIKNNNWQLTDYEQKLRDLPNSFLMTGSLLSSFTSGSNTFTRYHQYAQTAQLALAVERYYLAHRQLPTSTDNLIPTYLTQLPSDLSTGAHCFYRPASTGFIIYTPGNDRVDNEGQPFYTKSTYAGDMFIPGQGSPYTNTDRIFAVTLPDAPQNILAELFPKQYAKYMKHIENDKELIKYNNYLKGIIEPQTSSFSYLLNDDEDDEAKEENQTEPKPENAN